MRALHELERYEPPPWVPESLEVGATTCVVQRAVAAQTSLFAGLTLALSNIALPALLKCLEPAYFQQDIYRAHALPLRNVLLSEPAYGHHAGVQAPKERFALGLLPTPIHRWAPPGVPEGCELWIKRDDLSGMELSGNKVPPAAEQCSEPRLEKST